MATVAALRYNNWKISFLKQNAEGLKSLEHPFEVLRAAACLQSAMDPFERAGVEDAMGFRALVYGPCVRASARRHLRRGMVAELPGFRLVRNLAVSTSTA